MTLNLRAPICLSAAIAVVYGIASYAQPLTRGVPSGMVRLPGGTFTMGTETANVDQLMVRLGTKRREFFTTETPAHVVMLNSFLMDRTEVSAESFSRWRVKTYRPDEGDFPVTHVTWDEAASYCQSIGKRLPSEAEWEFAAGSGRPAEFPWGDDMPSAKNANWLGAGIGANARWKLRAQCRRPV